MQSWSVFKRAKDKKKKDAKWMVSFTDENGKRRTQAGYSDREATEALGRRLQCLAARRREGLVDPFEQYRTAPISETIAEYVASLKALGRNLRYISQVQNRINILVYGTRVRCLGDLDSVAIRSFISGLKSQTVGDALAGRTCNEYITSIKGLTKWAVINSRLPRDPLVGLRLIEAKNIEPKRPKRALSETELARLLDAAQRRPLLEYRTINVGRRKGRQEAKVSPRVALKAKARGDERRMAYLLAAWTGLRRSELRALRWSDIHLDTIPPHIPLRGNTTKSKRADILPLHRQLASELRNWKPDGVTDESPVFHTIPDMKTFRADLALAGIPDVDERGCYVVFHALRVTSSTRLASNAVTQRAAQALMRHKDPRLTAGTYTDERLLPLAAELEKLPPIPTLAEINAKKTIPLRATGTSDTEK